MRKKSKQTESNGQFKTKGRHPTVIEENLETVSHSENVIGDETTAVNLPHISPLFQSLRLASKVVDTCFDNLPLSVNYHLSHG